MAGQSSGFTTRRRGRTRQLTFAIALSTRGAILRQGSQSRTSAERRWSEGCWPGLASPSRRRCAGHSTSKNLFEANLIDGVVDPLDRERTGGKL
jgi:hypothetical protein